MLQDALKHIELHKRITHGFGVYVLVRNCRESYTGF